MKKSIFLSKAVIDETLAVAPTPGKKNLEPLKSLAKAQGLPITILENSEQSNKPEIHRHEDDLWICLEGETTFVVGGELVGGQEKVRADGTIDSNEISGGEIKGGETHTLKPGDILYIPAGEPHAHSATGTVRLYIIKLPKR